MDQYPLPVISVQLEIELKLKLVANSFQIHTNELKVRPETASLDQLTTKS